MSVWLKRALLSAAILGVVASAPAEAQNSGRQGGPRHVVQVKPGQVIPGQYIVVLRADVADPGAVASEMARAHGLQLRHVYSAALKGFSATVPEAALTGLRRDPRVDYIEADQVVQAWAQTVPTGIERIFALNNANIPINGVDDYRVDVDVAVIDTGIDLDHPDLNVVGGVTFVANTADDGNGHGSHVAGTIAGLDNNIGVVGVAPGARLWAVRVLDRRGSGSWSGVIAGIDWVTANKDTIKVANMSLGGGHSNAVCAAVESSVAQGVVHVVAAGNSDANTDGHSPADCGGVITVSALADFDGLPNGLGSPTCRSDVDDTLANFSNWGDKVEIAAPGVCIYSAWKKGGYATISGTSMASPHVAGAAALLVASGTTDPGAVLQALLTAGNWNWVDDSGDGIQEPLLDVSNMVVFNPATEDMIGGAPIASNDPPEVGITSPGDGLSFTAGTSVTFAGWASDAEDGDLTAFLDWTSDLDGAIGDGAGFSTSALSLGSHTITASVTDSDLNTTDPSIGISIVESGGGGATASTVDPIGCRLYGGRTRDRNLDIEVTLVDDLGGAVAGALVSVDITLDGGPFWTPSATTSANGTVIFSLKKADAGSYVTTILTVNSTPPWDGVQPAIADMTCIK